MHQATARTCQPFVCNVMASKEHFGRGFDDGLCTAMYNACTPMAIPCPTALSNETNSTSTKQAYWASSSIVKSHSPKLTTYGNNRAILAVVDEQAVTANRSVSAKIAL